MHQPSPKHCLNCGYLVKMNYCPQCSQSATISRLTWRTFLMDFVNTLTHAEKSIAGTTWNLIKNPGKVMDEYCKGKRKKYQGPVGFYLVWVTASILLHRLVISIFGFHPVFLKGLTFSNPESIRAFVVHGEWIYLITFPISAGIFYLMLARPLYTYIECIVITMYAFAVGDAFFVLCYLVGGLLLSLNVLHWGFYLFQIVLSLAYSLWAVYSLLSGQKVKMFLLRMFAFMVINYLVVMKFLELFSNIWVKAAGNM